MEDTNEILENPDQIILAEIYAILHDLGKLSSEFILQQSTECLENRDSCPECNFDHKRILEDEGLYTNFLTTEFKQNFVNIKLLNILNKKVDESYLFLKELDGTKRVIKEHEKRKSEFGLIKLLAIIDGLDSGVDKGILHYEGKQPRNHTRISTSFGYEKDLDIASIKKSRDVLCGRLSVCLHNISEDSTNILAQRKRILELVKEEFLKVLGETRRSGNDVTLWDHSYSVSSLYKSAIANMIHEKKWIDPKELKWVIIGIQYDKLSLIEKAHKLTDIVGYRELTEHIDEEIKKIIEEDIPLGNEIYRDESGIYFVGPAIEKTSLENLIKKRILNRVNEISDGEVIPYVNISKPSRSLVLLTKLLKESKSSFQRFEIIPKWNCKWVEPSTIDVQDAKVTISSCKECNDKKKCTNNTNDEGGDLNRSFCKNNCVRFEKCIAHGMNRGYQIDICPVCKVHPKCEYQEVCKCCLNRRERRIRKWLSNDPDKKYDTIWIDEIADSNKNLAFVTARFNLCNWLNGELLNTVFSQTLDTYKIKYVNWSYLRDELKRELEANEGNSKLLKDIAGESYRNQKPREFYEALVVDRNPLWDAEVKEWDNSGCEKAAEYLLLSVFRKHPSPSRLRRVWTSTENFWKEIRTYFRYKDNCKIYLLDESKKENSNGSINVRFRRLEVTIEGQNSLSPGTYIVRFKNFEKLNIVMYFNGKNLISTQNLSSLELKNFSDFLPNKDLQKYVGNTLELRKEGERNSKIGKFEIKKVSYGRTYNPFLEVLLSPITFQFIVPATSVPQIMSKIYEKYSEEMGMVAGRLPLNVSVVFFDSKTALYAVVNASRKILNGFEDDELKTFIVKEKPTESGINLIFDNSIPQQKYDQRNIEIQFKNKLEDSDRSPTRSDNSRYYQNFIVDDPTVSGTNNEFKTIIHDREDNRDLKKVWLVNAIKLENNGKVQIYPNYFDFEFLDTTARRLEIRYDQDHKRINRTSLRGPTPYYFEEFFDVFKKVWSLLEESMTTSQLKNVQSNLAKLHLDWDCCSTIKPENYYSTLKTQIENILINAGNSKWWASLEEKDKELILGVCIDKTIFDILEFYNSILKMKPNGDKNE